MKTYPPFKQTKQYLSKRSWSELQIIAKGCDVPFHTLEKIARGITPNPRIKTVEAIADYLAK